MLQVRQEFLTIPYNTRDSFVQETVKSSLKLYPFPTDLPVFLPSGLQLVDSRRFQDGSRKIAGLVLSYQRHLCVQTAALRAAGRQFSTTLSSSVKQKGKKLINSEEAELLLTVLRVTHWPTHLWGSCWSLSINHYELKTLIRTGSVYLDAVEVCRCNEQLISTRSGV